MKWREIWFPELQAQWDPYLEHPQDILCVDLECSACKFHLYPPAPVSQCPRCGEDNEEWLL